MSELATETSRVAGRSTIRLVGELDAGTVGRLIDAAGAELRDENCLHLVLELSGVSFVDSLGLGALVELHNRAEQSGTRFGVTGPTRAVARTLQISGLGPLFGVED